MNGAHGGVPGCSRLALAYGFFTHDVKSLVFLFEQTLVDEYFRRIPQSVPLPLRMGNGFGAERVPLRIGYFKDDGWFTPVPSCQRAVEKSKNLLESQGIH